MAFAPDYEPTTDFSQDEANVISGRSTVRTNRIDAEFSNIAITINTINNNLQNIQRSDNKLKDKIVEKHALSDELRMAFEAVELINQAVTDAQNARDAAQTSAEEAAASAASASEILTTTMRKITVNTDDDIPAFASLLSDYIIKVKSSARNGGFSTTYYFDFDNQSLNWIPTVGI